LSRSPEEGGSPRRQSPAGLEHIKTGEADMADGRKMLGELSASVNRKLGGPRR
jgi:hypothetical protein